MIISTLLLLCVPSCDKPSHKRHIYETIPDAVTDVDGNHYDAVRIGDQVWMKQYLRTTRYADGTEIPQSTFSSSDTPLAEKKTLPLGSKQYGYKRAGIWLALQLEGSYARQYWQRPQS